MNFYKPPTSFCADKTDSLNLCMPLNRPYAVKMESTNLYKLPSLAVVKSDSVNIYMLLTGLWVVKTESTNFQNLATSFTAVKTGSTNLYKTCTRTAIGKPIQAANNLLLQ